MRSRKIALCLLAAPMLAACAGTPEPLARVDGAVRPVDLVEPFSACRDWEPVERQPPEYPDEMMLFLMLAQETDRIATFAMSFNVLDDGSVGNIRLDSPTWLMDHEAYSSAPRAASEAMLNWRYRYIGDPPARPSHRCLVQLTFAVQGG